ncbi:DNA-binding transcriptional LysR family regulator [Pseudoduganella flava]|uniref:DNA-binding transcriptional LysR family regulator n=1 Tax=Pseudoduganella flava TaxID=871742 RepID=A0A562PQ13_9BURK|nr:LysR family transcriptional regulator [Pseudoduganella flava]QGZ37724.1 LysR family transcriptional regulator [Pseudoduganella flava]TWI46524.1 DNA-binding transcriptional LysR family regulator [Pseudoduganella flava]
MVRFEDLALFVRTAACGSFTKAAREANLLPGQVSAAIMRLERDLEIRLFARSTRSLRLTDEGERYLPFARDALALLHSGRDELRRSDDTLSGTLQLAAPSDLGRNVLLPWLTAFRRQHPKLELRVQFSDQVTDVFRDPVDIAIRYGQVDDASYVALPIAPDNRRVLVASPGYLEQCGAPQALDELPRHSCLLWHMQGRLYDKWGFPAGKSRRTVQVKGPLASDDADIVRRWAIDGEGIAYKSWLDVSNDVRAGRLVVVLPEQPGEPAPLQLICPHRKQFSPAVRQLHALLQEKCAGLGTPAAAPDAA